MFVRPAAALRNLREAGYEVRVDHYRWVTLGIADEFGPIVEEDFLLTRGEMFAAGIPGECIHTKGGRTDVVVGSPDGLQAWSGVAVCSRGDAFSREVGLGIALERIFRGAALEVTIPAEQTVPDGSDAVTFVPAFARA